MNLQSKNSFKKSLSCKSVGQSRCQQEHCSNLSFDIENQTKLSSRAPRQSNQVALIIFRSEMNQPTEWGADTNYKLWHGKPKLIFITTTFLDLPIQATPTFLSPFYMLEHSRCVSSFCRHEKLWWSQFLELSRPIIFEYSWR